MITKYLFDCPIIISRTYQDIRAINYIQRKFQLILMN